MYVCVCECVCVCVCMEFMEVYFIILHTCTNTHTCTQTCMHTCTYSGFVSAKRDITFQDFKLFGTLMSSTHCFLHTENRSICHGVVS